MTALEPATPDTATPNDRLWKDARRRLAQLEISAAKLSTTWFLGISGLVTAAVMFFASALVLWLCLNRLQDHFGKAQRSEGVLSMTFDLQESLDEAVSEARGFMALKDNELLQLRQEALKTIRRQIGNLKTALRDDPEAERMVRSIEQTVWLRAQMFDEAIKLSQGPNSTARLLAGEPMRRQVVRRLNGLVDNLQSHESAVVEEQRTLVHFDIRFAIVLVLLTGVAAPVSGLIGIHLLRRERDVRASRELQMELMHAQRLSIMGETSAMLAHEINQPLTAATNYLALLRRHLEAGAPDKAASVAERIGQQIQRAGTILKKLRRFIEKREAERSLEAPEVLVEDALTLLGTIDQGVALNTEIGDGLPRVLVDRVQLQQVLVNLMRNAIEAMENSPRRDLLLRVVSPDGKSLEVSLADSGPGLPPKVTERLFQPFVTTKEGGMGVGLSICCSIIAQHGGRIWAEPNPGGGTIFRFTLPAVVEREHATAA